MLLQFWHSEGGSFLLCKDNFYRGYARRYWNQTLFITSPLAVSATQYWSDCDSTAGQYVGHRVPKYTPQSPASLNNQQSTINFLNILKRNYWTDISKATY
jgi:hypothetical protein